MVFTTFDRTGMYEFIRDHVDQDTFRIWTRNWNTLPNMNSNLASNIIPAGTTHSGVTSVLPYYADQILPFDVSITFLNEYGQAAVRSIYGVELLNEGSGVSMDDMQIEETMTYVARELGPMVPTSRDHTAISGTIDQSVVTGFGLGSGSGATLPETE